MTKTKIQKVGNSLGIILPMDILNIMGLTRGDEIDISIKGNKLNIILEKRQS